MRKNIVLYIVLFFTAISNLHSQNNYVIKGELEGIQTPSKVILQYDIDGNQILDSTIVRDNEFLFKGDIRRPVKATLTLRALSQAPPKNFNEQLQQDSKTFYLAKGKTIVLGSNKMENVIIKGTKIQDDYAELDKQLAPLNKKMNALALKLRKYIEEGDKKAQEKFFSESRPTAQKQIDINTKFIYSHPDSYISLDLVADKASTIINPKTFEPFYNALSKRMRNTEEGQEMYRNLKIAKHTEIGNRALDFEQKDTKGKLVSLSSLRGKYILLDFWASWCGPCRAQIPELKQIYRSYSKNQKFDVLGISLDDDKSAWLKAIKDEGISWINVSDLKGFKNSVALKYGVKAVPQNFLIDPEGVIVGKNLSPRNLNKKLSEIFNTK